MRAVAARVGAVPMALYNHFATKGQLVDALLDRVLGRFEPEPPTDDWAEDLRRFARDHRSLLVSHPWAVAPLFTQPNPGIGSVRVGELALGILRRGGFSSARAVAAFSGIIALNYGWSSFTTARELDPESPGHDVGAMLAQLPSSEYPLTVESPARWGLRQRSPLRVRARPARGRAPCRLTPRLRRRARLLPRPRRAARPRGG